MYLQFIKLTVRYTSNYSVFKRTIANIRKCRKCNQSRKINNDEDAAEWFLFPPKQTPSYHFSRNSIYDATEDIRKVCHIFMNETRVIDCDTSYGLNGKSLRMSSTSRRSAFFSSLPLRPRLARCRNRRFARNKPLPFSTCVESHDLLICPTQRRANTRIYSRRWIGR